MNARPLVAHVLHSLGTGGMERVAVSVINGSRDRYRHAVICLTGFGPLRAELDASAVACVPLDKRPGKDPGCYVRLWRTLRRLRPDIVQTYNIGALDAAPIARLAGVRRVVQAEHGWDAADPAGTNAKYQRLRRWLQPCITRYVAVSGDIAGWLRERVGIAPEKIVCIRNGIDTALYAPRPANRATRPCLGAFAPPGTLLLVNVARLDPVKDQANLIEAFALLRGADPALGARLRLAIVGDGPARVALERQIAERNLGTAVTLLGNRADVPELLAESDVFVLSSIAEGIPLTVLEAMAAGLPVVSTRVGGVAEVVTDGATGTLVAPSHPAALAAALGRYVRDAALRQRHGEAGHAQAEAKFGLGAMVSAYIALYDQLLAAPARVAAHGARVALAEPREH
ncbi:MAG TPA: TIGR03088 family PEP-CTERM/XrtA system glycosyltransferase [Rhodanobacteraceae bacterium]